MNIVLATSLAATATLLLSGCADTPVADADYGSSVPQLIHAQTYDPVAASNPPEVPPEMSDGDRLKNALKVYRDDVAKGSTEVKQSVVFEVGSN